MMEPVVGAVMGRIGERLLSCDDPNPCGVVIQRNDGSYRLPDGRRLRRLEDVPGVKGVVILPEVTPDAESEAKRPQQEVRMTCP